MQAKFSDSFWDEHNSWAPSAIDHDCFLLSFSADNTWWCGPYRRLHYKLDRYILSISDMLSCHLEPLTDEMSRPARFRRCFCTIHTFCRFDTGARALVDGVILRLGGKTALGMGLSSHFTLRRHFYSMQLPRRKRIEAIRWWIFRFDAVKSPRYHASFLFSVSLHKTSRDNWVQ